MAEIVTRGLWPDNVTWRANKCRALTLKISLLLWVSLEESIRFNEQRHINTQRTRKEEHNSSPNVLFLDFHRVRRLCGQMMYNSSSQIWISMTSFMIECAVFDRGRNITRNFKTNKCVSVCKCPVCVPLHSCRCRGFDSTEIRGKLSSLNTRSWPIEALGEFRLMCW